MTADVYTGKHRREGALDTPGTLKTAGIPAQGKPAWSKAGRLLAAQIIVIAKEPYPGRHWSPYTKQVEPNYVCYQRLLFQQKNFERYGWDLGPITPILSAGKFYWDVLALPYHAATRPCQQYDTSAGKCLPGDPTPFFLYPVEFSVSGLAAEAAVVTGAFFVFP